MKREQILLLMTALILGLMGWGLLRGGEASRRVAGRTLNLELPELGPADPVAPLVAEAPTLARDPFREPRETEPLAPLAPPLPPVEELAALLPPPWPDCGPTHWSRGLLSHPQVLPGSLEDLVEVEDGAGAPLRAAEQGAEQEPASGAQDPGLPAGETAYAELYDALRIDALTVLYGRILDDDRYDLKPGAALSFQEVDPRSGRDRFAPRRLEAGSYESFSFARTLRNDIELRVRALNPGAGAIRERWALVDWLLAQGDRDPVAFERAESVALQGTRLAPDDLQSWMVLGEVWERSFALDQAFSLYARLSGVELPAGAAVDWRGAQPPPGRFPRSASPRVGMARVLRRLGMNDLAEQELRAALALGDVDPSAARALAEIYLEDGRAEASLELLRRSQNLYPTRGTPGALQHAVLTGEAHLQLADWPAAAAAFREAGRAAAGQEAAAAWQITARSGEIAAAYLAGDFPGALAAARDAVSELGSAPGLLYLRGIAAAAAGASAAEVILDLRAAAAASPWSAPRALTAQAFWLDVIGHGEEASQALAQALELQPDLPYGLYLRARWARRDGDLASAKADLSRLVAVAPRCSAALGELGWLLHEEGVENYQKAEVALRRAEQEAPHWTEIALRRAFNLLAMGDTVQARAALERVSGDGAVDYSARNGRALAAYQGGDPDAAVAEFAYLQDLLRDDEQHPQRLYAETWQRRIQEHRTLVRWRDAFDGVRPRPAWDVQSGARLGVEPQVRLGALRFAGGHREAGETRAHRALPAAAFRSCSSELTVGAAHRGEAGVALSLERRNNVAWMLRVYRDQDGRLRWSNTQGNKQEFGEAGDFAAAGAQLRVEFSLDVEQTPPLLTVRVNGRKVFQDGIAVLRAPSGEIYFSAYARTMNALPVEVSLDNVELIFSQTKP